ncbi:MAG: hypothetical protein V1925_00450 [Candidatus Omnitrophota bacterium]
MRSLITAIGVLLIGAVLISGCETAAGAAKGIAYTAEGAGKDTVNIVGGTGGVLMKLDNWMRENLW